MEELTIEVHEELYSHNLYDRIAQDKSRLRTLSLGEISDPVNLFSGVQLCNILGHRLQHLDVGHVIAVRTFEEPNVDGYLARLLENCPQVSVSLTCDDSIALGAMRSLRDLLLELH